MRNLFYILIISLSVNAQESKFQFRSFSIGHGVSGSSSGIYGGGLNIAAIDLATTYNENIFSLNLNLGAEFSIFDSVSGYHELNLTYGKELVFADWFKIEGHAGVGYINYLWSNGDSDFMRRTVRKLGIPIRLKILFYTGKYFGLGLNPNANINAFANMYSCNLVFQWKLR